MNELTVVVASYNRRHALERCLLSLSQADYPDSKVRLIISIDGDESNQDVLETATLFHWKYGEKEVIYRHRHLGLRKHIMLCGNLSRKYGQIIMLEDDIYVSPDFYGYALQTSHYYRNNSCIAGISLYSPRFNESAKLPFEPLKGKYDVFFCQLPSSWGQVWTSKQWTSFTNWYKGQNASDLDNFDHTALPRNMRRWPPSSWKKYYAKYMLEQNKFFVFPYESLSTNFGDQGTHFRKSSSLFQVALASHGPKIYHLDPYNSDSIVYDSCLENMNLANILSPYTSNITIDLHASKDILSYKRYALTTRVIDRKIITSFDLSMRPIEANILHSIPGVSIFLYDMSIVQKPIIKLPSNPIKLVHYYSWDKDKRRRPSQ